jgi:hypothetical protein
VTNRSGISQVALLGASALWAIGVCAGFGVLVSYQNRPGDGGQAPAGWPAHSRLVRDSRQANLILIAHPHCFCTQASIEELDRILTRCPGQVRARVLFLRPDGFAPGWEHTDLWRRAAAIPGVEVHADPAGIEARRFGVRTSGHVLLFDAEGRRRFSGGITRSRGHQGDNPAAAALLALLQGETPDDTEPPVFGCPLEDPASAEGEEGGS